MPPTNPDDMESRIASALKRLEDHEASTGATIASGKKRQTLMIAVGIASLVMSLIGIIGGFATLVVMPYRLSQAELRNDVQDRRLEAVEVRITGTSQTNGESLAVLKRDVEQITKKLDKIGDKIGVQ